MGYGTAGSGTVRADRRTIAKLFANDFVDYPDEAAYKDATYFSDIIHFNPSAQPVMHINGEERVARTEAIHVALHKLCDLLSLFNGLNDAEPVSTTEEDYSSQIYGTYGHIYRAIEQIVAKEWGVDMTYVEVNWGGNGSWYRDLIIAIEEQS